jgi:prepilin-type N-terminal cleavage/methylation domain-containing protein
MINNKYNQGFTLIEVAIVLIIVGFLLTAFLLPLKAQRDIAFQLQTQTTLENAKKALIGFAQTNGRLPCPATNNGGAFPDGTGTEAGSGACPSRIGFLPATTLGLQPTDAQGYLLDAWNNRIIYAVTDADSDAFTTNGGMDAVGIASLAPDLRVCQSNTCAMTLIANAPALIISEGPTGAQGSGGLDESENSITDTDVDFVSHTPTEAGSANGEFDHMVVWLSPYVLYHAMIEAGQLH